MEKPSDRTMARARRLRREETFTEKAFWKLVRDRRLENLKFRRQAPFGPYVVDFVTHAGKLVVELDGGVHVLTAERDAARDAWIKARGYRVLRIWAEDVLNDPEGVLLAVGHAASGRP